MKDERLVGAPTLANHTAARNRGHKGEAEAMNSEPIVVVDLRIPFSRLVLFFVKAALAMIPAAIILFVIAMVLTAALAAVFGGGHFNFMMQRSF